MQCQFNLLPLSVNTASKHMLAKQVWVVKQLTFVLMFTRYLAEFSFFNFSKLSFKISQSAYFFCHTLQEKVRLHRIFQAGFGNN